MPKKIQKKEAQAPANLKAAMDGLHKLYGPDSVVRLSDAIDKGMLRSPRLPTGILALDFQLRGGIPCGKITEIYGDEGAGKSTLAVRIAQAALSRGKPVLWVDAEKSIEPDWFAAHGVKTDDPNLYISQPATGQEALNILHTAIVTGQYQVVVLDSIGAIVPKAEIEAGMEKGFVGAQPLLMNRGARSFLSGLNTRQIPFESNKTALILINQIRIKIGVFFGDPSYAAGGKGKDHAGHLRLELRCSHKLAKEIAVEGKPKKLFYGQTTSVLVRKSKIGVPVGTSQFDIITRSGVMQGLDAGHICNEQSLVSLAVQQGIYTAGTAGKVINSKGKAVSRKKMEALLCNQANAEKLWGRIVATVPDWSKDVL